MSIMRRHIPVLALVAVMAAFVSGCGGDGYKGLTKAEFLRQANTSCKKGSDSQSLRKQLPPDPTPEQIAKLDLEKALPLFNRELDRIEKLKPPKADRDQVKKVLELMRSDAKAFAAALEENPRQALAPGAFPFEKSSEPARAYGLTICVS